MKKPTGERSDYGWRPAARAGQILIPSLLVIPSLLLFVYLLFETTKLSREKIRQQFAVDSAAFIQMGDYTNLLNRTAYVNGAFPYRIFKEAFDCPGADGSNMPFHYAKDPGGPQTICSYQILFEAGAYPRDKNDVYGTEPVSLDDSKRWEIAFDPTGRPDFVKNPSAQIKQPLLDLVTPAQILKILVPWTSSIGYFNFYYQVYSLLGTVEKSQWTVFSRLTESFNFFRKSYYLNANTPDCVSNPDACGEDGIASSGGFKLNRLEENRSFFMHYVHDIAYRGRFDDPADQFDFGMSIGVTNPPIDMTKYNPDGLFQLATVDKDKLKTFGDGLHVYQGWDAPGNYFKVDFNKKDSGCVGGSARPCVHSMVTTQCPGFRKHNSFTEDNNCVWPDPTPKYQTRLYP